MLQQMLQFFTSAFYFPGIDCKWILAAIILAIVFGAIWLAFYRPPVFSSPWLFTVAIISAILTWFAIAFIQIPLQSIVGQALLNTWNQDTLLRWLPLAGIPQILLSGIVQEGAKLLPVIFFRWRLRRDWTPRFGLLVGAVAGAGFGIFEAIWVHNTIFASGWTWNAFVTGGFTALLGFWERFFAVGFHIAVSALAGYGLARGTGWQFYLLASLLHGVLNYSVVLVQAGILTMLQLEIYVAVITIALTAAVLWLHWQEKGSSSASMDSQETVKT